MVFSCLVEPLVKPLVGRSPGRTALGRRLCATALIATALAAVTTNAQARALERIQSEKPEAASIRNAHQKPAAPSYTEILAQFALPALRKQELEEPGEAANFENDALRDERHRPRPDPRRTSGNSLGQHRQLDALLRSRSSTYLRFGSGQHRAGAPTPQFA